MRKEKADLLASAKLRGSKTPFQIPYTDGEWALVEKSFAHLNPSRAAIDKARTELQYAMRQYVDDSTFAVDRYKERAITQKFWDTVAAQAAVLEELLASSPRPPSNAPIILGQVIFSAPEDDHLPAIRRLKARAEYLAAHYEKRHPVGYPKAAPSVWFQVAVLEVWTRLGGELRISRNRNNKIAGPLWRYFAAASAPVLASSPESLPSILENYRSIESRLEAWRKLPPEL